MKKISRYISVLLVCTIVLLGAFSVSADSISLEKDRYPLSAGFLHSAVIKADGTLWMTGSNQYGQLGDGTLEDKTEYVQVGEDMSAVYAGYLTTFALGNDGILYGWGNNESYLLGREITDSDGNILSYSTEPETILTNVVSADLADYHAAAITSDGMLWMWGWNSDGQLGANPAETTMRTEPKQVMEDVKAVALGMKHTLVLRGDNSLWAVGGNDFGQLGDSSTTSTYEFKKILNDVKSIDATPFGTFAVKNDGTLMACGYNSMGEIGDGSTTDVPELTKILDNIALVTCGRYTAAAIDMDKNLWAWGSNEYGQINGEMTNPVPAKYAENVIFASVGGGHVMYLTGDGQAYSSGNNEQGQIGNSTVENISEPEPVIDGLSTTAQGESAIIISPIMIIIGIIIFFAILVVVLWIVAKRARQPKKPKPVKVKKAEHIRLSDEEIIKMAKEIKTDDTVETTGEENEEINSTGNTHPDAETQPSSDEAVPETADSGLENDESESDDDGQ